MTKFVVLLAFFIGGFFSSSEDRNLHMNIFCDVNTEIPVAVFAREYDSLMNHNEIFMEKANLNLRKLLLCSVFLLSVMMVVILYVQGRDKNNIIDIQATLYDYKMLESSIKDENSFRGGKEGWQDVEDKDCMGSLETSLESVFDKLSLSNSQEALLVELKKHIAVLCRESGTVSEISHVILKSKPYQEIQEYIGKHELIPASNDKLWSDLEKVVLKSSKNFKKRLSLLLGGHIDSHDLRLALLIKCGVTPSQKAILLGRTKSTITYRRGVLCSKLLGKEFDISQLDRIIRIL